MDGLADSGDGRTFLLVTPPPCEKPAFIFDDATSTEGCKRGGGNGGRVSPVSGVPKRRCSA